MKLVIVESQTKTKKIASILSKLYGAGEFKVMASLGHIRDLPRRDFGIDIEQGFAPTYTNLSKKSKVIKRLRDALKQADGLYLASDLDREGEAIAWHLRQVLKPKCPVWRVSFNAITEAAIKEAFAHPADIDMKLVAAQETRRIVDRLVGYKVSPVLWTELEGSNLSAGRVQSATLALIVQREREIKTFTPEEYWQIDAQLLHDTESFSARLIQWGGQAWTRHTFPDKQTLDQALAYLNTQEYFVTDTLAETVTRKPHPPFITSSLQQAASTHLKLGTERTMSLAQKLYEHGLITYMRTDSPYIAPEAQTMASQYIQTQFGDLYLPAKPRSYTAKGSAQEAHEAIRPTDVSLTDVPSELDDPLYQKLYLLIWQRFLASQMADAEYLRTRISIQAGQALLQAESKNLGFEAFLVVYAHRSDTNAETSDAEQSQTLPYLSAGDACTLQHLTPQQKFTKAPSAFTEASIVQYLEQAGIGRPSTYASTIATLKNRDYVKVKKRKFVTTALGLRVASFLEQEFTLIFDPQFTAAMETALDKVASGDLDARTFLDAVWQKLKPLLVKWDLESGVGQSALNSEGEALLCPVCHLGNLQKRTSRKGDAFYSCDRYPECKYSRNLADEPQFTGEQCPECSADLLIKTRRDGGNFIACSNFPACRHSQSIKKKYNNV